MIRSPSTSSSSHDRSRGQATASDSCAISTVSPSLLSSRRADQAFQHRRVLVVGRDRASRDARADRLTGVVRRDQAHHEVAQQPLLGRGQLAVEPLRGLRDGFADAARRGVARNGQGVPLAAPPGLTQHVRQERQRPCRAFGLAHEQVHQPGSRRNPACAAGPSMALRSWAGPIAPRR